MRLNLCVAFFSVFAVLSTAWGADLPIDDRVPGEIGSICEALSKHWNFLYERAAPEFVDETKKAFTLKRTSLQTSATQRAIEVLNAKGHVAGTGKALVMGGAYEVDLNPILENFAEVHVVDMSGEPLKLASRVYNGNPKLKLIRADLSGIPSAYQADQLKILMADVSKTSTDEKMLRGFFENFPEELDPIPFESGTYDLVVSPVLVESLSHGPLVAVFEAHREAMKAERKGMSDLLGEPFFYHPEVMAAFRRVFFHHSSELNRLLTKKGVATVSIWKRDDMNQMKLAPHIDVELVRVGDDRIALTDYLSFKNNWSKSIYVGGSQVYGPDKNPSMHLYVLEK